MSEEKKVPDSFKAYEDGKHRRYSLLFAVNGGAFAVAKLYADAKLKAGENPINVFGGLTQRELALGMILFTIVMVFDIFMFGRKMRKQYLPDDFGWPGKMVLMLIGFLICAGWFLALSEFSEAEMLNSLRNNIDLIATLIALLGAVGTVGSLIYAARQLRASKRSTQADLLFKFDEILNRYDEVHKALRPGGKWRNTQISTDEWPDVERYMGLFERIKIVIDDGFIDIGTFDRLYGYRIDNVTANHQINQEKLVNLASGWRDFNELAKELRRHRETQNGK